MSVSRIVTHGFGPDGIEPGPAPSPPGLSMANTWRLLANPVSLTYVRKVSKTAYDAPVTVSSCQIRMLTQTHVEGDALLRTATLVANLWSDRLLAAGVTTAPKPQDVLTIGPRRYTITEVDHCARAAVASPASGQALRYRCSLLREP